VLPLGVSLALGAKIERWIAGAPAARNRSEDLGR
jgi:hypothetical protein